MDLKEILERNKKAHHRLGVITKELHDTLADGHHNSLPASKVMEMMNASFEMLKESDVLHSYMDDEVLKVEEPTEKAPAKKPAAKKTAAKKTTVKKAEEKAEKKAPAKKAATKTVAKKAEAKAPAKKAAAKPAAKKAEVKAEEKKAPAKKAATKTAAKKTTATKKTTAKKTTTKKAVKAEEPSAVVNKKSVQDYIDIINWKKGEANGMDWLYIEVKADDLLTEVEAGVDNLSTVCEAIQSCMLEGDTFVVDSAADGKVDPALTVRYYCDNLSPERKKYSEVNH